MGQYGVIYIINNKNRDGKEVFKIGRTNDLDQRLKDLNGETSNLGKFKAVAFFPVSDTVKAETDVHKALQQFRIQNNKEFFKGNQFKIIKIVQSIVSKYKPKNFTPIEQQEPNQEQELFLARQGDSDQQKSRGLMYEEGQGVKKDYKKAVKWYQLSADKGNAHAQYLLGLMYAKGRGVNKKDYKKAVKWYRLSAEKGNAKAQYNLGLMYEKGIVVSQNSKKAERFYNLAAEQGDRESQYKLGMMYYKGRYKGKGVPQDYVMAHVWLTLSGLVESKPIMPGEILMSPSQIREAKRLARNWKPKK